MTADSVPAPMVQVPAETVEALREAANDPARINVVVAARALLDAATPAASVPAADILALAEKWEDGGRDKAPVRFFVADLRELLVAAAEQADKGEAADTPHDETERSVCIQCGRSLHPTFVWADGICAFCRPSPPASPPEPVEDERCMASLIVKGEWFGCENGVGHSGCHGSTGAETVWGCGEPQTAPARVPVNDEAEAAWQEWVQESKDRNYTVRDVFVDGYLQAKADASVESTITRAARQEDA